MHIRNILVFSFSIMLIASCSNPSSKSSSSEVTKIETVDEGTPMIKFESKEHDFGQIFQGEKVSHIFKFKNIGSADLVIKSAAASCGCTVPTYPRDPITPGESGEIEVVFDSNGRHGKQLKTITVWTNINDDQIKLKITSEIVELK